MANPNRLTTQQCIDLIEAETGTAIKPTTFRSYAHRGQAPAPVETIGRTPLWSRKEILEWAHNRPGQGVRTDLATRRRPRRTTDADHD